MRSQDNLNIVSVFEKRLEGLNIWTWWVPHQETSRQVDHLHPIFDHLIPSILNVPAWAAIAGGIAHHLNRLIFVPFKGAFAISKRSQAFPSSTGAITVTNDDPNFRQLTQERTLLCHLQISFHSNYNITLRFHYNY
jgi:hypothetical protein